jgi:SAM-dependent methyltransferase
VTDDGSSYDQVPYTSLAFPQTHPDHLAAIGRIFGLAPPDVSTCRVLELGCASGGNLIPMAFNLPHSEFVGIDVSQQQVDGGKQFVRAMDLRNIRIEHASILDVDQNWGTFDYILCHGVFSWVEADVQDRILRIAGEQLSPEGIVYISYNTYPGWHLRQMVRDMMRYHAGQFSQPDEQVAQARALLDFLASASQGAGSYGQLLAAEAERAGRAADSYLFHEHLERTNLPLYFHQFVARAERAGLQYLAESNVSEMLTSHFPPAVAETLERISPDILHLEQYMDFVRNRQFRQTLLCRSTAHPRRTLVPAALRGLLVSSAAVAEASPIPLDDTTVVAFTNGRQRAEVRKPATKAALAALADAWPRAIAVDALCDLALGGVSQDGGAARTADSAGEPARGGLLEDLFGAVMYGLVTLHTHAPPCTNHPGERPRAYPVAARQAQSGNLVVNTHHQMLQLDAVSRAVMTLADGSRGYAGILDELEDAVANGRLELEPPPETTATAVRDRLAARLDEALTTLTRNALWAD